jgi:hypothetical protein
LNPCEDVARGRRSEGHRRFVTAVAAAFLAVVPSFARATSYVALSDDALAAQSPLIAVVRVLSSQTGHLDRAVTDYDVEVERLLKGTGPARLVVRVAGGQAADGSFRLILGAPRLETGTRAILFLEPRADGTYGILQYMLGAFREEIVGEARLAVRDLSEAVELRASSASPASERPRDFEAFAAALAGSATARESYRIDAPAPARAAEPFFFFDGGGGIAPRWFSWDAGGSNVWYAQQNGQAGNPAAASQMQLALAAWNNDSSSQINMVYGGTTAALTSINANDGLNVITFDDPFNDIAGSFNCSGGGVLALGGPTWSGATQLFHGNSYHPILEGDVVTQDGAGCAFAANGGSNGAEVLAHELGHAIGFRHSCGDTGACDTVDKDEALMRSIAHFDGRGARVGIDDQAGANVLYFEAPAVTVVFPNGGDVWPVGTSHIVSWRVRGALDTGRFEVVLNVNGTRTALGTVPGFARRFTWGAVPLPTTTQAKIEVNYYAVPAGGSLAAADDSDLTFTISAADTPYVSRMRLFNPPTSEHLYTTSENEYVTLGTSTWIQEGVTHNVFRTNAPFLGVTPIPLYRLYHASIAQHLWTTDAHEYAVLPGSGWIQEGVDGYLLPTAIPGTTTPLFRLAYQFAPLHLWTTDLNEYDTLAAQNWLKEGIVGHVIPRN